MQQHSTQSQSWKAWALAALAAVLLLYAPALENAFHFDDFHTVVDNPAIRSLHNVPAFFRDATLFSVLPANRTYRPVVSTSLAIDYALGRGTSDPFWFHLSTLLWFSVLVALLILLWARLTDAVRPHQPTQNRLWAVAAAAWFGLHPAMAETVNYVIQRGDLYCTLGCVTGLFLWARWPRFRRTGLYLLPVALALLSKPPAAIFPALLGLWVWFFEAESTPAARWRRSALSMLPSLLSVAALLALESHLTPKTFLPSTLSATGYRLTQPLVWLRYAAQLFLPLHLNVDTDLAASSDLTPGLLAGFAFVAALLAAFILCARRRALHPIAFGLGWFLLTQLPTSLYALSEAENDHRMFFSFPGLMLAVLWTLRLAWERLSPRAPRRLQPAAVTLGLLLLGVYAWGAHLRNQVWRTDEALWRDDVRKSPHNGRGLMNYGLTLMARGDDADAQAQFEQALRYTPNYPTLEINLGIVNGQLGNTAEAERHFTRAIALDPADDQPYAYYGRWLLQQGRTAEALARLEQAVRLNPARPFQREWLQKALDQSATETTPSQPPAPGTTPQSAGDWITRSLLLNRAGQFDASIAAARHALQLDPHSAIAWNNIAAGFEAEHRWDEAIAAARRALTLDPDLALAKNNLAWSLEQNWSLEQKQQQRQQQTGQPSTGP